MDLDEFIKIIKEGDISHIQRFLIRNSDEVNQTNSEGKTYLMVACELGNTEVTKLLIDIGADLDKRDGDGKTALYYAVWGHHKAIVSKIITAGADLTIADGNGDTPLHLAVRWVNKDVVEIILKAMGGDTWKINQINKYGFTPLHLAVKRNNPDVVSTIISEGADLTIGDGNGDTPLHSAVVMGYKDVVEIILKAMGGDSLKINQINKQEFTPLHLAVKKNQKDVVSTMISVGVDLTIGNDDGDTPLHSAARWGYKDVVEIILKAMGRDTLKINKINKQGSTALHLAVDRNHKDVVYTVIDAGADLTIGDCKADTPIHLAAWWGNIDVVEIILKAMGGDTRKINQRNKQGSTPLHLAVDRDHEKVVSTIISAGAALTIGDCDGHTPLHSAARWGNIDVLEIILKAIGGDTRKINQRNKQGATPLYLAVENNKPDVVSRIISAGADLTIGDGEGNAPLHRASVLGNKDVVEIILQAMGGDTMKINQQNKQRSTPLHLAVDRNYPHVASSIISAGADATIGDCDGDSPLHLAVRSDNKDVVEIILTAIGRDTLKDLVKLDIKNHDGKTPLHLAVFEGDFGVIRKLISKNADLNCVDDDGNNCLHLAVEKDVFHCEGESLDILDKYCTNLELSGTQRLCGAVVASYLADNGANLYHRNNNNKTPLDLIRNPELKVKIKILFPALRCMLCEIHQSTITFQPCGHNVICSECSEIELKRCPKCRECIISKTGFEISQFDKKGDQTMPQPVETTQFDEKGVQTMPQPVEIPQFDEKGVQTMPQPVEISQFDKKGFQTVPQPVGEYQN